MQLVLMDMFSNERDVPDKFIFPVIDGRFEYIFESPDTLAYSLVLLREWNRGAWMPMDFIADRDVITFHLTPHENNEGSYKAEVSGGVYNASMSRYNTEVEERFGNKLEEFYAEFDRLYEGGQVFNADAEALYARLNEADSEKSVELYARLNRLRNERRIYSDIYYEVEDRFAELKPQIYDWSYGYFLDDPGIFALSRLYRDLSFDIPYADPGDMKALMQVLEKRYPDHPYIPAVRDLVEARSTVKPGNRYIEVSALDTDGNERHISEFIEGKIAVINLWASWCEPCRRKAIQLIPIYEKYEDKGFTVFSVAAEFKNTDKFLAAMEQDGYPWPSLVDLDNRFGIWSKYGIPNAGGGLFLVDEHGEIVLIDTYPAEIEEYLRQRFD